MKRFTTRLVCLLLCAMLMLSQMPALADSFGDSGNADWTVLIYLCGTDLESQYGMATVNLEEISRTLPSGNVNVIIETGGAKKWKAQKKLGLDIASDRVQRYSYDENGFTLIEDLPLDNMAQAETLSDFISWGAENYPADKYMLTLWDHGGGSMTGLIMDEMHDGAIMSLEDMGRAISDSGVHIEALMLDTCLMATIETAYVIDGNVNYLIASEEVVPGKGSNYKGWLQYLYDNPECNGARLGRSVCDSMQQKYAEQGLGSADTVTMSVIDINKMQPVYTAFDKMFTEIGALLSDVTAFSKFALATSRSESYYKSEMRDLADMANRASGYGLSTQTAKEVVNAVDDAVVYSVKGASHSYSHGLSFYYAPTADKYYMERYARNCFSVPYLAFLDATHMDWTAPASTYESYERLPEITYEDYTVEAETSINSDGQLQLNITNAPGAVSSVDAVIFHYNTDSDTWHRLGRSYRISVGIEDGQFVFLSRFDGKWPTLNGVPCQMNIVEENNSYTLYGIPCAIGDTQYELRAAFVYNNAVEVLLEDLFITYTSTLDENAGEDDTYAATVNSMIDTINGLTENGTDAYAGHYEVYGIWGGSNSALNMPGRDVTSLSDLAGQDLTLLLSNYNVYTMQDLGIIPTGTVTIDNSVTITESDLPAGLYAYSFVITDVLKREQMTTPVFFKWDGQTADFSNSYNMADVTAALAQIIASGELDTSSVDLESILSQLFGDEEEEGTSDGADEGDEESDESSVDETVEGTDAAEDSSDDSEVDDAA